MPKTMKKQAQGRVPRAPRRFQKTRLAKSVANTNSNTFKTTCKWNATSTLTSGITVGNYVYIDSCALQGVAAVAQTREFSVYSKLFDQYRVTGVTMRIVPRASTSDVTLSASTPVDESNQFVYSAFDVDSPIPSSILAIQTMRSCRKHSTLKPIVRTFKYKYGDNSWLDTATDYSSGTPVSNWLSKGLYAHFGIYGENVYANMSTPWATIELLYHVVFRGQRLVNVSQDEAGQVLLGNPEAEMKPPSSLTILTGFKPLADSNELDDVPPVVDELKPST